MKPEPSAVPKITVSTSETYSIRHSGEWGTVILRDLGLNGSSYAGEVMASGSFGTYSHFWGSMAKPLKEWLPGLNFSYAMGKLAGDRLQQYDHCATVTAAKRVIIESRRDREMDKGEAREVWEAIESCSNDYRSMMEAVECSDPFRRGSRMAWEWFQSIEGVNPQAQGFWDFIWLPLMQHLRETMVVTP